MLACLPNTKETAEMKRPTPIPKPAHRRSAWLKSLTADRLRLPEILPTQPSGWLI